MAFLHRPNSGGTLCVSNAPDRGAWPWLIALQERLSQWCRLHNLRHPNTASLPGCESRNSLASRHQADPIRGRRPCRNSARRHRMWKETSSHHLHAICGASPSGSRLGFHVETITRSYHVEGPIRPAIPPRHWLRQHLWCYGSYDQCHCSKTRSW